MADVHAEKEQELSLLINTKYARITIHRRTLKALGEPEFVHWGYDFRNKSLILFGKGTDAQKALRVSLNKEGACYMYSKSLITGLQNVSGFLKENGSFVLKGKLDMNISAVSFPLAKAQKVMEYDDFERNLK